MKYFQKNTGLVLLSLFDGMGCMPISLKELGIPVNKHYSSEKNPKCIEQIRLNFPEAIHLGDVRDVDVSKIEIPDVIAAGSPCTDLSFSGTQSGLICSTLEDYLELRNEWLVNRDETLYYHNNKFQQSILFWEFLRILKEVQEINPDVIFLLENVLMDKKQQKIINDNLGLFPVEINSSLQSAQRRKRLYWTNIRTRKNGLFGELHTDIPQPEDLGLVLKDILEDEVDEKYYIDFKPDSLNHVMDVMEKSRAVRAGGKSSLSKKHCHDVIKVSRDLKVKNNQDKASTFTAGAHSGGNHSDMDCICIAQRGRNPQNPSSRKSGEHTEQRFKPSLDGKTNTVTTVQKDNYVLTQNYLQYDVSGKGYSSQQDRAYYEDSKMCSIPASRTDTKVKVLVKDGYEYRIRRLTEKEVCRLQTIPEWYKWCVASSHIYMMLGNGWTVSIIKHILSYGINE